MDREEPPRRGEEAVQDIANAMLRNKPSYGFASSTPVLTALGPIGSAKRRAPRHRPAVLASFSHAGGCSGASGPYSHAMPRMLSRAFSNTLCWWAGMSGRSGMGHKVRRWRRSIGVPGPSRASAMGRRVIHPRSGCYWTAIANVISGLVDGIPLIGYRLSALWRWLGRRSWCWISLASSSVPV